MSIFHLPDLGEGLPEAEIIEWYVAVGDEVDVDQPLVSVETAKAVVDIPSPQKGKIKKLYGDVGDIIKTESALLEYESDGEVEVPSEPISAAGAVGDIEIGESVIRADVKAELQRTSVQGKTKAMPAARIIAKKRGIDLGTITPSNPNGVITVEDVEAAYMQQPQAVDHGHVEQLRGIRRAMVYSMTKSRDEVVPITVHDDADVHHFTKEDNITLRIIRALVHACQVEPALNVHFESSRLERIIFNEVNLILAMDSEHGLFTPVIHDVGSLSDAELRSEIDSFKTKVKDRTISPQEMQGGTITLSNFGIFAGRYASPVVVPPTVAILGVGKICEDVVAINGKPEIHRIIPLSLTVDHRVITGAETIRFLAAVIESLQS